MTVTAEALIRAQYDPALSATVIGRRSLVYTAGDGASLDRPPHVRAGSAMARIGAQLVVVQDDASFIAVIDGPHVRAVSLPAGPDGRRQFEERLGNKHHKLDLEACVLRGEDLVCFGSGSTKARERIVIASGLTGPSPRVRVVEAPLLYRALHEERAFAGSELNLEGAALRGGTLVLFQRGNGATIGGRAPVNATCELSFEEVWAHLLSGGPPPLPKAIIQYDLGTTEGVPFTFTDATCTPSGALLFLAAAEDSPDTYNDGPVAGVAIGMLAASGAVLTQIREANGEPLRAKAEGICLRHDDPSRADVVTDRDDPDLPCELLEIELRGFF